MGFLNFPDKVLKQIKDSNKSPQEILDEKEAERYGFKSKIELYCTLCRGDRIFRGCGQHKTETWEDDSLLFVYYKCHECNNVYSGHVNK